MNNLPVYLPTYLPQGVIFCFSLFSMFISFSIYARERERERDHTMRKKEGTQITPSKKKTTTIVNEQQQQQRHEPGGFFWSFRQNILIIQSKWSIREKICIKKNIFYHTTSMLHQNVCLSGFSSSSFCEILHHFAIQLLTPLSSPCALSSSQNIPVTLSSSPKGTFYF